MLPLIQCSRPLMYAATASESSPSSAERRSTIRWTASSRILPIWFIACWIDRCRCLASTLTRLLPEFTPVRSLGYERRSLSHTTTSLALSVIARTSGWRHSPGVSGHPVATSISAKTVSMAPVLRRMKM